MYIYIYIYTYSLHVIRLGMEVGKTVKMMEFSYDSFSRLLVLFTDSTLKLYSLMGNTDKFAKLNKTYVYIYLYLPRRKVLQMHLT